MTARSTRPTTRLWTGATALLLLLVIGSAVSQGTTTTLDEAATSQRAEVIAESPKAGSIDDPLRKVDAGSATLKDVVEEPSGDSAKPSKNAERVDITDNARSVGKSEKPGEPIAKIGKNDGKTKSSKREFSEIEDNRSSDVVESSDELAKKKSNATQVDAVGSVGKSEKLQMASVDGKSGTSLPEFGEHEEAGSIDDGDEDREPTTQPPRRELDEGRRVAPKDLGPKDRDIGTGTAGPEEKGPEIGSSLANDTNVNFNTKKPIKKNDGDLGGDASGTRSHLENATNAIATGGDAADGPTKGKGPKAQVEVVRNTTLPKILRMTSNATKEIDSSEQKSVVETTPESVRVEKTRDEAAVPSGADADGEKRGRTISFAGSNEFVTGENKTGGSVSVNAGITDSPVGNVATGVTAADFRPYPYAKSDRQSNSSAPLASVSTDEASSVVESTEEASALENTIGQSQQDKKFVVTEPSVVIDNSIQQFKPTYYKRSGNTTRIATTSSPMPATPSTESIVQGNVTNPPFLNAENDVPRGKSEQVTRESAKDVTKDTGLDLTGNGITEVIAGVRNDSNRVSENSVTTATIPQTTGSFTTSGATDDTDSRSVQNSTEKIVKVSDESTSSVDVQTDPEESMLRVSSLNVTEGSTKVAADQQVTGDSTTKAPSSSTMTATSSPEGSSVLNSTTETSPTSTSMPSKTLTTSPSVSESSVVPESASASMTTETSVTSTLNVTSTDSPPTSSPMTTSTSTMASILPVANTTSASNEKLEEKPTTFAPGGSSTVVGPHSPETEEFSADDRVESTTSKIEYVFVGLTESTASQQYIATSEGPNAVTADREVTQRSHDPSSVVRSSTVMTLINNSESSTAAAVTPEEMVTQPITLIADNETNEDFTTTDSVVEFTTLENNLATTKDDADGGGESTTTIDDPATTIPTNESAAITTEDVIVVANSTEAPTSGVGPNVGENTTDTGRAVDSSTSRPEAVDTTNSSATTAIPAETTSPAITEEPTRIPIENTTSGWPIEGPTTEGPTVDATPRNFTSKSESETTTTTTTTPTPRTVTSTTENGTGVVTDGSIEIVHRGGVPSLVKVVFEGSWTDVCPHLDVLRQSLADLLTAGLEKTVLASQIVFQSNPCSSGFVASTTETSVTTLLLYVVDENGNFDAEMTKTLPSLYSKSPIKLQVIIRSFQLVQDSDSGNAIAVVVVSCVALICLVLLAGLLFIMRKRQTRFNYGERCRPVSLDAYSLDSVSAYNSVRRKGAARASKRSYGNPTFEDSSAIPSHPLNFAGLSTFCNEQNAISEEFAGIPQVTARIDELPQGAEVKNRYANVVPLPETRVSLMKINNDPLTEYINASYVRGPKNATKYYIACQAPIESTVTDFWRMIWEQQSKVVIMLTDLVENGVEKCAEYVPPSEVTDCHRLFGDFQVTLKKRETKEKYAISTLHLKNLENNTFREISHIWYLWPANGVQSDAAGLIAVLLEARALQRGGPGPIVVHCSPGTGRTGTLIALDLGIRQYEITRTVDVPRVVYTIRRDRAGAVQTKEQYAFIYKALNLYATKLAGGALDS